MNTLYLKYLLFFLSAGFANMVPVFFAKIFPKLNYPMDFFLTFRGKRLLGEHKTIRGFIGGSLIGSLFLLLFNKSIINESFIFIIFIPMSGLIGDAIKSFVKRQVGIKEGQTFFPFDQLDWILGLILALIIFGYRDVVLIYMLLIGFLAHMLFKYLGYLLKLEDKFI